MTGGDQLRHDIDRLIKTTEGQPWEFKLDRIMALIRQDRRELLEALKQECHYKLLPKEFNLIKPLFDAELQHGAGLDEADHE